jgi:aspartate kinase
LIRIFKFGGASVKDANGVRNAAEIMLRQGSPNNLVVVISAMGKTTNALELLFQKAQEGLDYQQEFENLKSFHEHIASDLFGPGEEESSSALNRYFTRLEFQLLHSKAIDFDMGYDQVVPFGEYLSTLIVYLYMKKKGVQVFLQNARFLIQTDMTWREGIVNMEETGRHIRKELEPLLKTGIVITQGFIGGTKSGNLTTLGREGSDYTAALMGHFLNAASVTIWKDVPGVLNADPKWIQGAVLLPGLSYHDAAELTYFGATVIHPKTIRPLAQKDIPLMVRSFLDPEKEGTMVGPEQVKWNDPAFIRKNNQTLVSFTSRDYSFMDEENISEVLHVFKQENLKIHMLQVSALSISVVTELRNSVLARIVSHMKTHYSVLYNENLTLYTIKNYTQWAIDMVVNGHPVILDQRSRNTCQILLKPSGDSATA